MRGGGGQVGQEARSLLGGEVGEGVSVPLAERSGLGPLVGEVGLSDLLGGGVLPPSSERLSIAISQKRLGVTPIFEARIVFYDQIWA